MLYNLNRVIEKEILKSIPLAETWFDECYTALKSGNYTKEKKFAYNDGDSEAYLLTTESSDKRVFAMGDASFRHGGFKTVICFEENVLGKVMTVHRISGQTTKTAYGVDKYTAEFLAENDFDWRNIDGLYGDSRDKGFVLRWEYMSVGVPLEDESNVINKLDSPQCFVNETRQFFFDLNNLNASIVT